MVIEWINVDAKLLSNRCPNLMAPIFVFLFSQQKKNKNAIILMGIFEKQYSPGVSNFLSINLKVKITREVLTTLGNVLTYIENLLNGLKNSKNKKIQNNTNKKP